MLFQLDNHHLSLRDRSVISPLSHAYNNREMLSSIPINILSNLLPTNFQFHLSIFKFVRYRNSDPISMRPPCHSSLVILQIAGIVLPYGLMLLPYPRPFFLQFLPSHNQTNFWFLMHITFSLHIYNESQ